MVWNGRCKLAPDIFQSALILHSQWILGKHVAAGLGISHQQLGSKTWIKPPEGVVKCNVDAALLDYSLHFGYGCIVRNSLGVVIATTHSTLLGHFNSIIAEALSI